MSFRRKIFTIGSTYNRVREEMGGKARQIRTKPLERVIQTIPQMASTPEKPKQKTGT